MKVILHIFYSLELVLRSFILLPALYYARDRERLFSAIYKMGVQALNLVLIIGLFTGAIIAWQAAYQFKGIITLSIMGGQVSKVLVMEVGPVLTALVLAGRVGSSIAAELGSMKITEQIEALISLNISIYRYLVMPRIVGLAFIMPVLAVFSSLTAILGAMLVSVYFIDQSPITFIDSIRDFYNVSDLYKGLLKTALFGIIISSVSCVEGLATTGGASGVGQATIKAFVKSALGILALDFLLWLLLF